MAAAAVAAITIVACGRLSGIPPGGTAIVSPPASALVPWQGFPADQHPRPIVWLGNFSPTNGFSTGDGKIALMCSRFALGSPLPKNLPNHAVATWTDGTKGSYPGISAADALAAISRAKTDMPASQCTATPPLVISGARLGTFDFYTDRGKAHMTAWLFSAMGANGELAYPALAPTAFWKGGMVVQPGNGAAAVSANGRSLTWTFFGAPDTSGACGADYKGVVAESATAVAVALQEISHTTPGSQIACPAIAQERSVTVTLANPLGGRVVVDAAGNAVSVCPAPFHRGC